MAKPHYFSWIEKPHLAAMAYPGGVEELRWLKRHGIEILLSLTEEPPSSRDLRDAGLLLYHVPVVDMTAPTQEDLDRCISAIARGRESGMGVGVHCGAGAGRTGAVLACYFVSEGLSAEEAIRKVRKLRPSSIETDEQLDAVREFAKRQQVNPKTGERGV